MKRFLLYAFRWQLSTPILALFTALLANQGQLVGAFVANLVGAGIFFWIDKWIFKENDKINGNKKTENN